MRGDEALQSVIQCAAYIIGAVVWLPLWIMVTGTVSSALVAEPSFLVHVGVALLVAAPLYGAIMMVIVILMLLLALVLGVVGKVVN